MGVTSQRITAEEGSSSTQGGLTADWPRVLGVLQAGQDLSREVAEAAVGDILTGVVGPARIAALLMGLAAKGESAEELAGMAAGMIEAAEPLELPDDAIDIVGTGGSVHRRAHALNISTMSSIVAGAAGAVVCKHGNRRASSTSGSFDFLEALGVAIDLNPSQLTACVNQVGVGFAFARTFHPAMRFAGPVRAELGIPTVFNLLGPLAHPGRPGRQVIGVSSSERGPLLAEALQAQGTTFSWVVAGADGLDELSTSGPSEIWEVAPSSIEHRVVEPEGLGLASVSLSEVAGGSPEENVDHFMATLGGKPGPVREVVALNAAAGLVVAGEAESLDEGLAEAFSVLDDGRALTKLEELRSTTQHLTSGY